MRKRFLVFLFPLFLMACRNKEAAPPPAADPLFLDAKVWSEEGRDDVNCFFQLKEGNADGAAVPVPAGGKLELDGQSPAADSTRFMGVYYEVSRPMAAFTGKHSLAVSLPGGWELEESFGFQAFGLAEEWQDSRPRAPFTIQLTNLPGKETRIRVVMIDTAFQSVDVNDLVPVTDGRLEISQAMLNSIVDGPVMFELYKEEELPLKKKGKTMGRLAMTYSLKREFMLGGR